MKKWLYVLYLSYTDITSSEAIIEVKNKQKQKQKMYKSSVFKEIEVNLILFEFTKFCT